MARNSYFWLILAVLIVAPSLATAALPTGALKYQRDLTRVARFIWGMDAPVPVLGAQIHQESSWRDDAKSRFAGGLAQFTPATAQWISRLYRDQLGEPAPYNPGWALKALVLYDRNIYRSVEAATVCDRWGFTLAAYNGGPGWTNRDKALAVQWGDDPTRWFGYTELHSERSVEAFAENRAYPRRILLKLQSLYAGWGPTVDCRGVQ